MQPKPHGIAFPAIATIIVSVVGMLISGLKPSPQPPTPQPPPVVIPTPPTPQPPKPDDTLTTLLQTIDALKKIIEALQADASANQQQIAALQAQVSELSKPTAPPVPSIPAPSSPQPGPAVSPATALCQCPKGGNSVCYCLKEGIRCHCPENGASLHYIDAQGRPLGKVTSAAKPAPASKPEASGESYPVTVNGNWMYWTVNGVRWNNQGVGTGYSTYGRWAYRNGRMYEQAMQQPAAAQRRPTYTAPDLIQWNLNGTYCPNCQRW